MPARTAASASTFSSRRVSSESFLPPFLADTSEAHTLPRFSIVETRFQGYASLAAGQTGTCRAGYTFAGDSSQEVVFQKNIVAPHEDNYNMLAGVGIESWTKCGGSTAILNVNSEVRITPVTSPNKGLMTVSNSIKVQVKWRSCGE